MVWTCRKLWGLSACKNYSLSFTSFLGCYTLKNPAIWSSNSILTHKWRTGICQIWDSMWNINIKILDFYQILDYFLEKLMTKFFKKNSKKTLFCGHFGPCFSKFWQKWIFLEKCCQFLNIPSIYHSEKKIRKNQWPTPEINGKLTERQTDGQTIVWNGVVLFFRNCFYIKLLIIMFIRMCDVQY